MEIPRDYDERRRFDAFCKAVLRNEARSYMRSLCRQRKHEFSLYAVPWEEMDKLCTADDYPSDNFVFSAHGYDLCIGNELVAEAFSSLSGQDQSILILRCVLDMTDEEISRIVGLSRSSVQRRRAKALDELRMKLAAMVPKGGKK